MLGLSGLDLDGVLTQPLPVLLLVIIVSAVLQDDLTCLVVGVYVSAGDLPFVSSLWACFVGALLGDFFWFFSGCLLGSTCLERQPFKWVIPPIRLARSHKFFERHGPTAILLARFLPVIRTPVQLAAGMFASKVPTCIVYFVIAAAVYTPLLVTGSMLLCRVVDVYTLYQQYGHLALLGVAATLWLVLIAIRFVVRRRA